MFFLKEEIDHLVDDFDQSQMGNLKLTWLDPFCNYPILYNGGTNDVQTNSMYDALHVNMVYACEGGSIMQHNPSLTNIKLSLYLSGSYEYY